MQSLAGSTTIALLSNTNEIHWQQVRSESDVFSHFAKLFLSYQTGRAKPQAEAFDEVTAYFSCQPQEIVFFDDSAGNVAAARRQGCKP